jgi:hypothetical protein
VARLEGDLDAEQERALDALLASDAQARRAWATMAAARIRPELVEYPHKAELKRGAKVIAIGAGAWMRRLAAAASIALLLGLGWWWQRSASDAPDGLAVHGDQARPAPTQPRPKDTSNGPGEPTGPEKQPAPSIKGAVAQPERRSRPQSEQALPVLQEAPPQPRPEPQPLVQEQLAQAPDGGATALPLPEPQDEEALAVAAVAAPKEREGGAVVPTLRQALAGAVRERVLESPADPARAFDATDAEAATNRALRTVAGDRAGFAMQRDAEGRGRGFDLRLGRHLALSARR